ncbi:spore germination protein [Paenibacillus sedimenti]|uniref:Spore germination protein n=1 Tax=Paenibacillus sedimenti TaxID=2770274 RepID=A0A926KV34_9BACL|nr:spore germination protein [Paenibacillus sedimenti]MBD0384082.1 spore germination protein [Paenibacillus sedimenti]
MGQLPLGFNIFNIKINNVSSGASANFGNNFLYNNNVKNQTVGTNTINGDASLQVTANRNLQNDSDLLDQPSII